MTYVDPLRRAAAATPAAPALIDAKGSWSYAELDRAADRLALRLVGAGVVPGDRVALLLPGGPEGVLAVHAVPRAGAILAPLNPKWSPPEQVRALGALAPRLVLVAEAPAGPQAAASAPVNPGDPRVPRMRLDRADLDLQRADLDLGRADLDLDPAGFDLGSGSDSTGTPSLPGARPSDTVAILWTSGTSGHPRGIELTRENLEASARAARDHLDLRPSDSWYAALNLAHVGGLALLVRAAVVGCRVVVRDGFSPLDLNRSIDAAEVTHASLVPVMLDQLLEARGEAPAPASLRCILLGGAASPLPLVRKAVALGFPVAITYGMTEASSQVATAPPALVREAVRHDELPGAPLLPGVEVRIADDGEILVRGPTVARGHRDGWLHTGDLGRIDRDGHLRVTGRISERIISGGVNIDPAEVEAVVRDHPSVRDAAVLGLPDPRWGERVGVAVVLAPGATLDAAALLDFTRPRLAAARRPRALAVLDALPRNANGKVDRERLRGLDWRAPDPPNRRPRRDS